MLSGAAAGGEGSQDEREREDSPPQEKSVEALTSGLSPRASSGLSPRASRGLSPRASSGSSHRAVVNEREQSLARELIQVDEALPSQAGTLPLALTTMRANSEETIVINPLALQAPTTTHERLELGPANQAKLDAVTRSRRDGTYTPPDGMVEWQRLNPSKGVREWIIWRNNQKAEAEIAKEKKLKLFPFDARPFNYVRLTEDEAPQLHMLSFGENIGDDEGDGNERFIPSPLGDNMNEDELGEDLDRLLSSSSSMSPLNGKTLSPEQNEDDMVDYSDGDNEEEFLRKETERANAEKNKTVAAEQAEDEFQEEDREDEAPTGAQVVNPPAQVVNPPAHVVNPPAHVVNPVAQVVNSAAQVVDSVALQDKPVLTQKLLMDIIAKQPQALMQKMEWEQKKQCYKEMLSGYESPNGTSINVGVDLTALMFVSAVSESAQMISLMAQSEASDKLMKQAEQHREALEKEFKLNMERMKAEHDRAITEAMKIRDNYARSALEAASAVNHTIQKFDQVQGDKVVNFQLETLKKRALKFERQLAEAAEKHEEELKERELLCDKQKRELLLERKRNKELEDELRAFEDSVINGTALLNEKAQRKSPDSSPDVPNPKRAKVELVEATSLPGEMDKAFKDLANAAKVLKDQGEQKRAYLKRLEDLTIPPVRAVNNPDAVMTSAYSQNLRDNANLLVMTKDARSLRPADNKISGDKQESSSAQQVVYSDDGGYSEPGPPIVTKEQRDKSLKMWKDALIQAGNYLPKQNLSAYDHDMNIRFLTAAMRAFRESTTKGLLAHKWEHGQYGPLQKKMFIPRIYCPVDQYFGQVDKYADAVYNIRCCPLYEYYRMLCKDTPGYVSKVRPPARFAGDRVQSNPRDYRPQRENQGFYPKSSVNASSGKQVVNPSGDNSTVKAEAPLPSVPALNPSGLDEEQIESADNAQRRRVASRKNAPIPEDEDSTGTESETTKYLFEDKMLPEDKATIMRLKKDIKRIKAQNYSADYLRRRDKAISAAEVKRLAGKIGPAYLAGVKFPWSSDHGRAPREYDDDQVDQITEQIDKIRTTNAALCQLEYTATKHGPRGQGKR